MNGGFQQQQSQWPQNSIRPNQGQNFGGLVNTEQDTGTSQRISTSNTPSRPAVTTG